MKHSLITLITFCQRTRERTASVTHELQKAKVGQSNSSAFLHLLFKKVGAPTGIVPGIKVRKSLIGHIRHAKKPGTGKDDSC